MLDSAGMSFQFEPLPRSHFDTALEAPWRAALTKGFKKIFATRTPTLNPIDVYAAAYLAAPRTLTTNPGGTLADFYENNDVFHEFSWNGIPVLWAKGVSASEVTKKLDESQLSITDGLSMLETFNLQNLMPEEALEGLLRADAFSLLAKKLNLSVDTDDLGLFIAAELARMTGLDTLSHEQLMSNSVLRELVADRAVDRALIAVRLIGAPKSELSRLRKIAKMTAYHILDNFDLSIIQNMEVNNIREELMRIYECFLLWMRLVGDALAFPASYDEDSLRKHMAKMVELLDVCSMLNEPQLPDNKLVKRLLEPGRSAIGEYYDTLDGLETISSLRQTARRIPRSGRVSERAVLQR